MKHLGISFLLITLYMPHLSWAKSVSDQEVLYKAMAYGASGQVTKGLKLIKGLKQKKKLSIDLDQLHLTEGRFYFQVSQFPAAINAYKKVSKTSDYWYQALEELTWAYIRTGQYDRARSKLATLQNPIFKESVSPEAYYAAGYLHLKTCDYVSLFKSNQLFKERFQERLKAPSTSLDLKEFKQIVHKLNLIEAEAIQRLYLDKSLKAARPKKETKTQGADVLVFPYTDELWIDEVDSYQAEVKKCPELQEAQL